MTTKKPVDKKSNSRGLHVKVKTAKKRSTSKDFILSGCAIFEAIARTFPIDKITIADRGVREGIIVSLMREVVV